MNEYPGPSMATPEREPHLSRIYGGLDRLDSELEQLEKTLAPFLTSPHPRGPQDDTTTALEGIAVRIYRAAETVRELMARFDG